MIPFSLLAASFIASSLSFVDGGSWFQLASIALLALSWVASLLENRGSIRLPSSVARVGLVVLLGIFAAAAILALFRGRYYQVAYSIMLIVVMAGVALHAQYLKAETLLAAHALSATLVGVAIAVFSADRIYAALQLIDDPRLGRIRLDALGFHPNLLGHIYAANVLGCFLMLLNGGRIWVKGLWLASLLLSVVILLATGSRGAVVALLLSIGLCLFISKKRALLVVGFTVAFIALIGSSADYLEGLFQLRDSARSLDSGLSGRIGNWDYVLSVLGNRAEVLLLGEGFRSSDELLGIPIDNGYLTVLYEMGLIGGAAWVLFVLRRLWSAARFSRNSSVPPVVLAFILFHLIESIVARYFLSIGNSASVIFLYMLFLPPAAGLRPAK